MHVVVANMPQRWCPVGVSACWCSRCAAVLNEGLSFRPGISMYFFDGWVYNYYVHDSTNLID